MDIKDIQIDKFEAFYDASSIPNNEDRMIMNISWSANIGFGQLTILSRENIKTKEKSLELYTETMGKEFAKQVLCKLIDDAEEVE